MHVVVRTTRYLRAAAPDILDIHKYVLQWLIEIELEKSAEIWRRTKKLTWTFFLKPDRQTQDS